MAAATVTTLAAPSTGSTLTAQELPWRQAECSPAGRLHPRAFICAVFESVSDVWMIEDFD